MTSDIKFSVTVPAYKAQFLAECIDSILAQTYKNFELIIVNDASPQDLDSIVSKYDDPRIRYYKNKVGFGAEHVVGNWNKCLEYATGDYIICMGDDDKLLPNCLEEYVKLIEKYPQVDFFHAWTEIINDKSEVYDIQAPRPEWESVYSMIYFLWKGRTQYIGDCLFKTARLRECGGFYDLPFAWSSDHISAYMVAKRNGAVNMQRPGFQYRVNQGNITNNIDNSEYKVRALMDTKKWYRDFFAEKPETELDNLLLSFLKDNMDHTIDRLAAVNIAHEISVKPSHIIRWRHLIKINHYPSNLLKKALYYMTEIKKRKIIRKLK